MKGLQLELPLFEEWLPIKDYEDLYQVSNYGRVKSLERIDSLGRTVKERILKPINDKDGYQLVQLYKDGKGKTFKIHRLVANAFIDNPNNLPQVNHIDEVKTNNHISNLEWCDCKYNVNFGTRNERHSGENNPMYGKFGKEHPRSKQIIQLTLDGEFIKIWGSVAEIQRELGCHQSSISKCCKNKLKSTHNYKWQYVNTNN